MGVSPSLTTKRKTISYHFLMMEEGVNGKLNNQKQDASKIIKRRTTSNDLNTNHQKLKASKSFSQFSTFSYLLLQLVAFSCTILSNSLPLQASALSENEVQEGSKVPIAIIEDGNVNEYSQIVDLQDFEEEDDDHYRQLRSTDHYLRSLRSPANDHYLRSLRA